MVDFASLSHDVASFLSSPLGAFIGAVILDIALGVALAVKKGGLKALSAAKFVSFISAQFGTTEAKVLGGLVAGAVLASVGARYAGGGIDVASIAKDAFVAAQLAAGALTVKVLNDCRLKAQELLS